MWPAAQAADFNASYINATGRNDELYGALCRCKLRVASIYEANAVISTVLVGAAACLVARGAPACLRCCACAIRPALYRVPARRSSQRARKSQLAESSRVMLPTGAAKGYEIKAQTHANFWECTRGCRRACARVERARIFARAPLEARRKIITSLSFGRYCTETANDCTIV